MEDNLLADDNWLKCPHCGGVGIRPVSFGAMEIGFRCTTCHAGPPDPKYKDYMLQIREIDECTQFVWIKNE